MIGIADDSDATSRTFEVRWDKRQDVIVDHTLERSLEDCEPPEEETTTTTTLPDETTTTTEAETTTTAEEPTTTTAAEETTTTAGVTTTQPEQPELPFTGIDRGQLVALAASVLAFGLLLVVGGRTREDA